MIDFKPAREILMLHEQYGRAAVSFETGGKFIKADVCGVSISTGVPMLIVDCYAGATGVMDINPKLIKNLEIIEKKKMSFKSDGNASCDCKEVKTCANCLYMRAVNECHQERHHPVITKPADTCKHWRTDKMGDSHA